MNLKGSLAKLKPSKPITKGTIGWLLLSVVLLILCVRAQLNSPKDGSDNSSFGIGLAIVVVLSFAYISYRGPKIEPSVELSTTPHSIEERSRILHKHVILEASYGWKLEVETEFEAVLSRGKRVNHILHLLLSLLTLGFWIIPWAIMTAGSGEKRETISVDECGNTRIS
jgi:hypothetical protein